MSQSALRLTHVVKRFGSRAALDGVSLAVRPGDCYGFLGHNGAGKTTALRIALGLIRADAGRVLVEGFDASRHPREARARLGGLIETPGFYPWLSGRRNLVHLARLSGRSRKDAHREAERLLEAVGLSLDGDRRTGGYSQGMRQRLGIAQALIGDPAIVLLDEPMNGLDPEGMEELRRLLVRLVRDEGRTVLLSSHQIHEVAGICNRIGILREGKLLVEAETADLLASDGRRHALRTDDDAAARRILEGRGITTTVEADGCVAFDASMAAPADVVRHLVDGGVPIREIAPRPVSLEEIYLRYSRGEEKIVAPEPEPEPPSEPVSVPKRLAPPRPILLAFAAEGRRLVSHVSPTLALLLPAVLAALTVAREWGRSAGHLASVESGEIYSHSLMTAFEAAAAALQTALPLAAVLVAGLASQSLAGELSRGTLRNVLLRPVGRVNLGLGKALGVLAATGAGYVLLATAAVVVAAIAFDFTDVVEILEIDTGEPWVLVEAKDLWPPFLRMLPIMALPLLAYAALGFLAGALVRTNVAALALSVGTVVGFDLARVPGRELGFERWLPSAYIPSPLGDTSYVVHVLDLIRAPNDLPSGYVDGAVTVPLVWIAVAVALAVLVLRRRSVP